MKIEAFLIHLRSLDVELQADGDRLRVSAPRGVLTSALRMELTDRKAEILAFLRQTDASLLLTPPTIPPSSRHEDVLAHGPHEASTTATLVERGEASRQSRQDVETMPILPVPRDRPLPLSLAQEYLWLLTELDPDTAAYNIPAAVRLSGPLDVAALEQSLNEIVRRHETLRTTFTKLDGKVCQVITPALTVALPLLDLQEFSKTEREAEIQRLATREALRLFDLARGPLLRTFLMKLDKDEHVLLVNMHHLISDGWSMVVLSQELVILYGAFSRGKPSPFPERPVQYADFAVWQQQWLRSEVVKAHLAYWMQQLGGTLPVLELPTDYPRPSALIFRGAKLDFALPSNLTEALETLSRQEGATLFMTLLAALKALLSLYSGQDDIIVGAPTANRNRAEIEGLIGFFINLLCFRTDLSGDPSFRDLLGRVREVTVGAYTHQDLPFEILAEELQLDEEFLPPFRVMFTFYNFPQGELTLSGLTLSYVPIDTGISDFDFGLLLREGREGLVGEWVYSTELFKETTMARMIGHYLTLLESVVANPERRLSDLAVLLNWDQG